MELTSENGQLQEGPSFSTASCQATTICVQTLRCSILVHRSHKPAESVGPREVQHTTLRLGTPRNVINPKSQSPRRTLCAAAWRHWRRRLSVRCAAAVPLAAPPPRAAAPPPADSTPAACVILCVLFQGGWRYAPAAAEPCRWALLLPFHTSKAQVLELQAPHNCQLVPHCNSAAWHMPIIVTTYI